LAWSPTAARFFAQPWVLPASILYRGRSMTWSCNARDREGTRAGDRQGSGGTAANRGSDRPRTDAALVRRIVPEMVTDKAIQDRYNATIAATREMKSGFA